MKAITPRKIGIGQKRTHLAGCKVKKMGRHPLMKRTANVKPHGLFSLIKNPIPIIPKITKTMLSKF
jgi:hypothetical protein